MEAMIGSSLSSLLFLFTPSLSIYYKDKKEKEKTRWILNNRGKQIPKKGMKMGVLQNFSKEKSFE